MTHDLLSLQCRRPVNLVKVIYVLARYLALGALMYVSLALLCARVIKRIDGYWDLCLYSIHYSLIHGYLVPHRTSGFSCQMWFSFLLVTGSILVALLNSVLFLRGTLPTYYSISPHLHFVKSMTVEEC